MKSGGKVLLESDLDLLYRPVGGSRLVPVIVLYIYVVTPFILLYAG